MQYTEHLALKKPGLNDYINIQDLNDNADLLDEEIFKSPQMYPLPFVDGVSEYRLCRYFKTQNNIVHIFGELKFTNGISADQENAFVLPAGYRPISHIVSPATYWRSDNTRCAGALVVGPDGYAEARISPYDIKAGLTTNMFFHTTFLAQE